MTSSERNDVSRNQASEQALRIRALNDAFRQSLIGGRFMITEGVHALGAAASAVILDEVRKFSGFSEDNDPYGEHDFGAVEVRGQRIFWKIDYYDLTLTFGSPNPADSAATTRVLTVMLASEY